MPSCDAYCRSVTSGPLGRCTPTRSGRRWCARGLGHDGGLVVVAHPRLPGLSGGVLTAQFAPDPLAPAVEIGAPAIREGVDQQEATAPGLVAASVLPDQRDHFGPVHDGGPDERRRR